MSEPTIICPKCQEEIKLTESLAAPLLATTRRELAEQFAEKEAGFARRESDLRKRQDELNKARQTLEDQVADKLKAERARISEDESKKARLLLAQELQAQAHSLSELQAVLKQRDEKLAAAQQSQAELLRKQRELEDARREMELTIEKQVQESLQKVRDKARQDAAEELKLKVLEREQTISSMQKQIEELRRRAEQGSQQLQGEVLELELETALRSRFPRDIIEPVAKGEFGGDILQRVFAVSPACCGSILWESKRTKNWSDGWLSKLRDDQRAAKADFAILVSQALPKDIETFDLVDGVWVTGIRTVIPVALALRHALIELATARQAGDGQLTKMELVYQYLTGPRFRHRVQAIVEKFSEMQLDLEKERKTMTRLWAKREEQIRGVIESTAGMYGDLQGIAGRTLQEIDGLSLPLLDGPES